jgi:hypothetical protein
MPLIDRPRSWQDSPRCDLFGDCHEYMHGHNAYIEWLPHSPADSRNDPNPQRADERRRLDPASACGCSRQRGRKDISSNTVKPKLRSAAPTLVT